MIEEERSAVRTGVTVSSGAAQRRRIIDRIMSGVFIAMLIFAVIPLALLLFEVVIKGGSVISLSFLTNLPKPPNTPGGGIANALEGSLIMVGLGTLISVPIGVGAGIFFSEWPESKLTPISSFMNDVLAEFPSIVIGVFVYVLLVLSHVTGEGQSSLAGAIALSIIMIPIVARTTEESLKIVPNSLREASMALGITRWKTIIRIVISTGKNGLATGILLAIARAAGESAPLLLTAYTFSFYYPTTLFQPTQALPVLIFYYGTSPFHDWQAEAWGAALILVVIMLGLNLSVKLIIGRRFSEMRAEI